MKRSEIIVELRQLRDESANARGWHEAIEERCARLIEALSIPAEAATQPSPTQPERESSTVNPEGDGHPTVQFDGDPLAPSLATLVTPRQLGMIRALAREAGVDYEVECLEQFNGVKVEELGKRAASAFIDYLKALQGQGAEFRKAS